MDSGPGLPAGGVHYGYYSQDNGQGQMVYADLVTSVDFNDAGSTLLRINRLYEPNRNLIDAITNVWDPDGAAPTISGYDYANDTLGRRESVVNSGAAFDDDAYTVWDYNGRGELTESHRYEGDDPDDYATDPKVEGEYFDFEYDPIGNRKTHSVGFTTPLESTYTAGELNQYRIIGTELPEVAPLLFHDADGNLTGTADLIPADMNCDGVVDFSDIDPFVLALSGCGGYDAAYPDCNCLNADIDGDGQVTFADLDLFVSQMGENGFRRVFTWDAENRLTSVGPYAGNTETGDIKVEFAYDYKSRRVSKTVSTYDGSAWQVTEQIKYVWDAWKLLMELDALNSDAVARKYTWGLDLAGQSGAINSLEDAGTIGGLLAVHDVDDPADPADPFGDFVYTYDANGNVGQVVAWATGYGEASGDDWHADRLVAHYEYSPYGSRINTPTQDEYEQPFRFSTKQWDDETGLGYWPERYYSPTLGRWMSRDPIGDDGGLNLYRYADGNPAMGIDPYGLLTCRGSRTPAETAEGAGNTGRANDRNGLVYLYILPSDLWPEPSPTRDSYTGCFYDEQNSSHCPCGDVCATDDKGRGVGGQVVCNDYGVPCCCVCPSNIATYYTEYRGLDPRITRVAAICAESHEMVHMKSLSANPCAGVKPGDTPNYDIPKAEQECQAYQAELDCIVGTFLTQRYAKMCILLSKECRKDAAKLLNHKLRQCKKSTQCHDEERCAKMVNEARRELGLTGE